MTLKIIQVIEKLHWTKSLKLFKSFTRLKFYYHSKVSNKFIDGDDWNFLNKRKLKQRNE